MVLLISLAFFQTTGYLFVDHLLYLRLHLCESAVNNTLNHHLLIGQEVKIVEGGLPHRLLSFCQLLVHYAAKVR